MPGCEKVNKRTSLATVLDYSYPAHTMLLRGGRKKKQKRAGRGLALAPQTNAGSLKERQHAWEAGQNPAVNKQQFQVQWCIDMNVEDWSGGERGGVTVAPRIPVRCSAME